MIRIVKLTAARWPVSTPVLPAEVRPLRLARAAVAAATAARRCSRPGSAPVRRERGMRALRDHETAGARDRRRARAQAPGLAVLSEGVSRGGAARSAGSARLCCAGVQPLPDFPGAAPVPGVIQSR